VPGGAILAHGPDAGDTLAARSPDGRWLVVGKVRPDNPKYLDALGFSPDGRWLVVSGNGLQLWPVADLSATPRELAPATTSSFSLIWTLEPLRRSGSDSDACARHGADLALDLQADRLQSARWPTRAANKAMCWVAGCQHCVRDYRDLVTQLLPDFTAFATGWWHNLMDRSLRVPPRMTREATYVRHKPAVS
jgi:hypothetical protein